MPRDRRRTKHTTALARLAAGAGALSLGLACSARDGALVDEAWAPQPTAPPPKVATKKPAPLGITSMIVLANEWVAATSPDLDALVIVEPEVAERARVTFEEGAEPGRLVESDDGQVHVVLRARGEVASVSWESGEVVRTPVCSEPRGIAQLASGSLVVTCMHGDLVELVPGQVLRRARISRDLRDVVATSGKLFVARFRAAEVLVLDESSWAQLDTLTLPPANGAAAAVLWELVLSSKAPLTLTASYQTATPGANGLVGNGWQSALIGTTVDIDPANGSVGEPEGGPIVTLGCNLDDCGSATGVLARRYLQLAGVLVDLTRTTVAGVPLEGVEEDDGHRLFHGSRGAIPCAACHPEGGDDGLVWRIDGQLRRTQSLVGDVTQTAPFHWSGDELDMSALMDVTLTQRLGGGVLSDAYVDAFTAWLAARRPLAPRDDADADAIARGSALFHRDDVGCVGCHAGPQGTDHHNHDVGRGGEPMQTPRLVGLASRAPYLHDGCARTLLERFSPACQSSDAHGKTSHLSPAELDDLVAYLESR
jgi:mono/diheme cytochrome c family protein